jgi:hypothetical protein
MAAKDIIENEMNISLVIQKRVPGLDLGLG